MKRRRLNEQKPEIQFEKARHYFKKEEDQDGFFVRVLPEKGKTINLSIKRSKLLTGFNSSIERF